MSHTVLENWKDRFKVIGQGKLSYPIALLEINNSVSKKASVPIKLPEIVWLYYQSSKKKGNNWIPRSLYVLL